MKTLQVQTGTINGFQDNNIIIDGKTHFIPQENREKAHTHPVGRVVDYTLQNGSLKTIHEHIFKDGEEIPAKSPPASNNNDPAPAQGKQQQQPPYFLGSQPSATFQQTPPVPEVKGFQSPSQESLLAMVNDSFSYWKAKTIMDLVAAEEIRKQVEFKNWSFCVDSAISFSKGSGNPLPYVLSVATQIHEFINGKVTPPK